MRSAQAERLLAHLRAHANARGIALAREGRLLEDLGWTSAILTPALDELVKGGDVEAISPLPFLAVRLHSWANHTPNPAHSHLTPYSYESSLSQSRLIKESYRGTEALLQEVLSTLGETDPTTFRGALEAYSPRAIRLTLERVRAMKHVRKSRTALFRFLLPRIAKEFKKSA